MTTRDADGFYCFDLPASIRAIREHDADLLPPFVTRLVTRHRDFNMGDCWHNHLARLRDGAEPESRNADLADTLDWLVALHRGEPEPPTSTDGGS